MAPLRDRFNSKRFGNIFHTASAFALPAFGFNPSNDKMDAFVNLARGTFQTVEFVLNTVLARVSRPSCTPPLLPMP